MRTEPVDIGCGVLSPLRSAALCAVYSFEHASHEPGMADDRPFGLHGLIATTAGQWVFRGRRGVIDIDSKITVAGTQGEHCGCRHAVPGNSILIAVMFPGSLDENEPPPFSEQVVEWDLARPLRLAMARNVDDDFESCLFEVFDLFARHTGGRGARPHVGFGWNASGALSRSTRSKRSPWRRLRPASICRRSRFCDSSKLTRGSRRMSI